MLQSVSESGGLAMYLDMACDVHGVVTIKSPSCFQLIGFRRFDDVSVEQCKTASSPLNTTTFCGVFVRAPSAPDTAHVGPFTILNIMLLCIWIESLNVSTAYSGGEYTLQQSLWKPEAMWRTGNANISVESWTCPMKVKTEIGLFSSTGRSIQALMNFLTLLYGHH